MRETDLVRVLNFDIAAEGILMIHITLRMVIRKTMGAELLTYRKPKS